MSGHTKGPWSLSRLGLNNVNGVECIEVYSDHGESASWIAQVMGRQHNPIRPNQGEANASLIVAAPDLYKALTAITEGMEASGGWIGDEDLFAQGMAALAKADGTK